MPRDCCDSLSWDNFLGIWSPDRYYIRSIYKVFPSMRVLLCFVSHLALILSRIYTTGCDGPCSPCVCPYPHCHEWRCIGRRIWRPFPNVQWVSAQAVKRIWSIHHPHRTSDWVSSVQRAYCSSIFFWNTGFQLALRSFVGLGGNADATPDDSVVGHLCLSELDSCVDVLRSR